jgi:parallel beta-helix repeat protein
VRNGGNGIHVIGSQCKIDQNTVRANTGDGINLPGNNNTVTRNYVNNNTGVEINQSGGGIAPTALASAATHPFSNFQ